MRYERCGFSKCGQLVEQPKNGRKKYCNTSCKQAAYRERVRKRDPIAKITLTRYCVNCGKVFTTTRIRQQFHNTSCRVSFHQQMKRIKEHQK